MGTGKERATGVYAPSFFYIGGKKGLVDFKTNKTQRCLLFAIRNA